MKPEHYQKPVAPWDLIACMTSSGDAHLDFLRGNVIKYAWRTKESLREDLEKAKACLEEALRRMDASESPERPHDEPESPQEEPEWHNPENYSQERLGTPEWRFLVKGEEAEEGDEIYTHGAWEGPAPHGERTFKDWTYRTKRPLPAK